MAKSLEEIELRSITKKELASQFNVHYNTILNWCKALGIDTKKGLLKPIHLLEIYKEYGVPG